VHGLNRILLRLIEPINDFKSLLLGHGVYKLFHRVGFCADLTDFVPGQVQRAIDQHENDVANNNRLKIGNLKFFKAL
jgi:hypothetical protein